MTVFQLSPLDRLMLAISGDSPFALCRMQVFLPNADAEEVRAKISGNSIYRLLASLKYEAGTWISDRVREITINGSYQEFSRSEGDTLAVRAEGASLENPFRLALFPQALGTSVVFGWHHALFDAHRAEIAAAAILRGDESRIDGQKTLDVGTSDAASLEKLLACMSSPLRGMTFGVSLNRPRYLRLALPEVGRMQKRYSELGMELFPSLVHLAAALRGYRTLVDEEPPGAFSVIMPNDARRKRSVVLGNHLNLFFFRVEEEHLADMMVLTRELLTQAESLIAGGTHRAVVSSLGLLAGLDDGRFRRAVSGAGRKRISLYFSDIGESLIPGGIHYPPHFYPPGFAVVFSRRGETGSATIVTDASLSEEKLSRFSKALYQDLIASDAS